ncbi:transcription factor HES-2-like [Scyliorhinus canicula]|uniref:transcription factor HES-2-like n=1 Tax=Scyliorhinus canicula TaxID=7830 RepID=UPI0018F34AEA|nr:transcription factor HES-2-like [Scyliorhinus canicula]
MKMAAESSDLKEVKKLLKPLVEKRRRERMNRSLEQLKVFLMKHAQSESFRNGKMDKAEILEMTVQYLRNAALASSQEPQSPGVTRQNYEAGFKECLLQVNSFVRSCGRFNSQAKSGLMERLSVYVDQSKEEKGSGRVQEGGTPSASNLEPLRGGQLEAGTWDAAPAAGSTDRPMAIVPGVSSTSSPHHVSNLLATRPHPSHHRMDGVNFTAKDQELSDSGFAHIRHLPQKVTVWPKAAFTQGQQQHSDRMAVPHNVWRPWP